MNYLPIFLAFSTLAYAQSTKQKAVEPLKPAENLIIVTLDGLRWQEFYGGADSALLFNPEYTRHVDETAKEYWASTPEARRALLMPFIWNKLVPMGNAYGYRPSGNFVNNANPHWFSYPGYNETFTGYPDPAVNSNEKVNNKHVNVLEVVNATPGFEGRVAAFTSWDAFDAILNSERNGMMVSSGFDRTQKPDAVLRFLDDIQFSSPAPLGESVRPDYLTFQFAKAYLNAYQPKVLYIGLDETDDYAHRGEYDNYLYLAQQTDRWIRDLWTSIQSLPQYAGTTALIISTDHGRGDATKSEWKDHGADVADASEMWFYLYHPGMKSEGVVQTDQQLHQAQLAQTIARMLGITYAPNHPTYPAVVLR